MPGKTASHLSFGRLHDVASRYFTYQLRRSFGEYPFLSRRQVENLCLVSARPLDIESVHLCGLAKAHEYHWVVHRSKTGAACHGEVAGAHRLLLSSHALVKMLASSERRSTLLMRTTVELAFSTSS